MPLAVEQDHDIDSDVLNFDSESEMDGGMYEEAAYTQDLVDSAYDLLGEDEDDRSWLRCIDSSRFILITSLIIISA